MQRGCTRAGKRREAWKSKQHCIYSSVSRNEPPGNPTHSMQVLTHALSYSHPITSDVSAIEPQSLSHSLTDIAVNSGIQPSASAQVTKASQPSATAPLAKARVVFTGRVK